LRLQDVRNWYFVATKSDAAEFEQLLPCLVEPNQAWAKAAPVLVLGCVSLNLDLNSKPNAAAIHNLGLASAGLTIEATSRHLCVHQMIAAPRALHSPARSIGQIARELKPV
jgi:hypothetical protein